MNVRGVVFDLDGTLADTIPVCVVAFRSAFEKFLSRRWADEEIKALFGPTEEGSCRQAVPDNWKGCLEAYLGAYERAHTELTEPFPGIEDALQLLKERRVATALVTGKGPASTRISLEYLGLGSYFELVETGSPDGPIKPKSLRKVLAEWGMESHEAAYVGDSAYDVEAAAGVGMIALGAAWAEDSTVRGVHPTKLEATFYDVSSFIGWIETNVPKVKLQPPDSS